MPGTRYVAGTSLQYSSVNTAVNTIRARTSTSLNFRVSPYMEVCALSWYLHGGACTSIWGFHGASVGFEGAFMRCMCFMAAFSIWGVWCTSMRLCVLIRACMVLSWASMVFYGGILVPGMRFYGLPWYVSMSLIVLVQSCAINSAGAIMVQRCAVSYFNCAAYFRNYAASSFRDGLDVSMSPHAPRRSAQLLPLTTATKNTE